MAQESGEGPFDKADFVIADASDYRTSLDATQSSEFVDHDLGKMAQPVAGCWGYRNPGIGRIEDVGRQRQNSNGFQVTEGVGLDDERWSGLAVVTGQRNRNEVSPLHACQSLKSEIASMPSSTMALSALALISSHCLRMSSRYPGAFTSGTQIVTGFSPAAFIFSRCFRTRFAPSVMATSICYM
jgi:hypothetical protein